MLYICIMIYKDILEGLRFLHKRKHELIKRKKHIQDIGCHVIDESFMLLQNQILIESLWGTLRYIKMFE